MSDTPFVRVGDIAKKFGLSAVWIHSEAEAGRLPALKVGRDYFYDAAAVGEALAARSAIKTPPSTLMDVRQLAARLGVPQKWIREEANAKRIPGVKAGPSSYLFDPELVDRVIAERAFNLDAAIYDRKSLICSPPAEQSDDLVRVVNLTVELGAHAWRCGWNPSPYIDALAEVGVKVEFSIPIGDSIRKFRALRQLDAQWPQYRPRDYKLRPHTQESRP